MSIVERCVAQCIGMGIDVRKTKGMLIVDFGAATTELSVVGSGGMVLNKMLKIGGMTFDVAVQNMVRRNYDFLIGRQTAEALRKRFGVLGGNGKASMVVAGRNLVWCTKIPGNPKQCGTGCDERISGNLHFADWSVD